VRQHFAGALKFAIHASTLCGWKINALRKGIGGHFAAQGPQPFNDLVREFKISPDPSCVAQQSMPVSARMRSNSL